MPYFWAMSIQVIKRRRIRQLLTLVIMGAVLLCIFPFPYEPFLWWSQQSAWIAVLFLVVGLMFSYSNRSRLMFVCLGSSAAVSFNQYMKAEHNMRLQQQESVSIGEIDLQKVGAENLHEVLSGAELPALLYLYNTQDTFDYLNALADTYPFLVRVQQDSGHSACLLSRLTLGRIDTLYFPSGQNRVAFRFPLENTDALYGWIICPLVKSSPDSGVHTQRPTPALRQPFVWLGGSAELLPSSNNVQSMSTCAANKDEGKGQILFSRHFVCNACRPIYSPSSVQAGTNCSLALSNYYVYSN
jgi:hypothetical protein